ncbi:RidA family protein [Neorhizobium sp. CSC1952]|uniref:Enamine deaminase RidA, house cleaning of reactive enamine intermediates, YjgF/YER057c/UK114 family n=1 Tax=Xaviernesmea oryzae TaxID=464029 RepID=A0A1X7D7Q3_9HYPH|nr:MULTISPECIES: RidA family protein [Rhizobium/Agrobacterium group]WJR65245.1 RidA family protein [Rhizobium sp. CSC1952]SMF10226.1 Enamine deaminase RidA, house cleaning of reactive enamine intermediates, YjgF/YER057c/UK114 family [Xaviernesmea oryzae]
MIKRHRKHRIMHGAVEHNGVLYLGGHAAGDISVGMKEQTQQTCAKLDEVLAECGSDKKHILSARIYLSDMSRKEEMNEAWLEWIDGDDLPSRATIGVADLGDPKRLIEIVLIAAKK